MFTKLTGTCLILEIYLVMQKRIHSAITANLPLIQKDSESDFDDRMFSGEAKNSIIISLALSSILEYSWSRFGAE